MSSRTSVNRHARRPGRPASHRRPAAREQLLSASVELFAEQGVAATTFAMIANRAGVTPAMLHYYYEDREQLLDAVVHERMAPVIKQVWNPVSTNASPTELVCGVVERLLD